ncbi:MAG: alpha/beta hydrolase [Bacteroidales bacterium]|nr:alpha/beta hydrolase [Bacteroidales bacterium]MCF8456435.1 alpha/beta hydrolase [Bacteroidales bacterium]
MTEKLVEVNGLKIHNYTQGNGNKTIHFLHGNSLSSETFLNQFEDKQFEDFNLISIDFPGHGKSEWSVNRSADYSLWGLRDIISSFVEQQQIGDFIFAGHSLGGHVAIECLPYVKNCKGLMVWGTPPISLPLNINELFYPHPDLPLFYKENLLEDEVQKLGKLVSGEIQQEMIHSLLASTDPTFRVHLSQSLSEGKFSDEVKILESSGIPIAISHGSMDPFVRREYLENLKLENIYKHKIFTIEGAGHSSQIECPTEFNPILVEFANSIFNP